MPQLLATVDKQRWAEAELLETATGLSPGEVFTVGGVDYARAALATATGNNTYRPTGRVWVTNLATGEREDQTRKEDRAFWTWAIVNTFYYTGIRLEELSELTATALFTYKIPATGEAVPLLQIVPSKTDEERVIMVPPELAHVLAQIRHRVRAGADHVPCVARYDNHEKKGGAPLPYLFQRVHGTQRRTITTGMMTRWIAAAITRGGITGPDGKPLHITPHDFRRVFATEALSGGLPVHILAKILGHQNLATTQGYTAIFQEDVIGHYRKFVANRRLLRPSGEYREPTNEEMEEFHRHFTKRKVELGICARAYGTPCAHEHACIRCGLLQPDPSQKHRLEEIIQNLHERKEEAKERGWLGEIEGLEISIASAEEKLLRMRATVSLGTPQLPAKRESPS